jgi:hypothetical protein
VNQLVRAKWPGLNDYLQGNEYFPEFVLDATRFFLGALPWAINWPRVLFLMIAVK